MRAGLALMVGVACASISFVHSYDDGYEEFADDKNIYVPFEYLDKTERWLYKVALGPSAWICGSYQGGETWEIYDLIDEYINSRNGKRMNLKRTTWPSIRTVPLTEDAMSFPKKNAVCHYIERELHCDVPEPVESRLYPVNKIPKQKFYMKEFWGQANDRRIDNYIGKMLAKMAELDITDADRSYYIVGYFDDNLKGLMFEMLDQ